MNYSPSICPSAVTEKFSVWAVPVSCIKQLLIFSSSVKSQMNGVKVTKYNHQTSTLRYKKKEHKDFCKAGIC